MKYEKLIRAVEEAASVALICHMNPDGDTIGSALALFHAFRNEGKRVFLFCTDIPAGNFTDLAECALFNAERAPAYDVSIAVDCSDFARLGTQIPEFSHGKIKVNIDHHKTNDRFGDVNHVDAEASATAEVIYDFLSEWKPSLLDIPAVAAFIFMGIVTDSGSFSFSSVRAKTFKIGADLVERGVNPSDITYRFMRRVSKKVFTLRGRVLNKAQFYNNEQVGVVIFRLDDFEATGTSPNQTEGTINQILNIDGVEIAVALTEIKDKQFKVSFRTKNKVDASRCAMVFGGGGHKNAAGCRVHGYYEDVLERILKVCNDSL